MLRKKIEVTMKYSEDDSFPGRRFILPSGFKSATIVVFEDPWHLEVKYGEEEEHNQSMSVAHKRNYGKKEIKEHQHTPSHTGCGEVVCSECGAICSFKEVKDDD